MHQQLSALFDVFALPLLGGALLGLAAAFLMLTNGRIAGISGILADAVTTRDDESDTRWLFLGGLVLGGVCLRIVGGPMVFENTLNTPLWVVALAGVLVGFGARLGSGCTAGHGICGLARLSPRSLTSVLTFITAGAVVTFVVRHLLGA